LVTTDAGTTLDTSMSTYESCNATKCTVNSASLTNYGIPSISPTSNLVKTVRLKALVLNEVAAMSSTNMHLHSFTLTLVNPCLTTTLIAQNLADMATSIKLATVVTSVAYTFKDVASNTYGNNDGYTLCGPRGYVITGSPVTTLSAAAGTST